MSIQVSNINQLYNAVNSVVNAGEKIVLAAGTYLLDASPARPNAGRLELQKDMELQGQQGDAAKVIIDASQLPDTSFALPLNFPARRTGAIRMGRGLNIIEWLKVIGNANATPLSVVDTDLICAGVTRIRIAHSIITGGRTGINIRNVGAAGVGRLIEAEIIDNDITGNFISDVGTQQGQGIIIQNANGASGSLIMVTMVGNNIHGNTIGMRVFNTNGNPNTLTNNATISIQSKADRVDNNKLGIYIAGGMNSGTNATANRNLISFKAYGISIQNNKGISKDSITEPCGIYLVGGSNSIAGSEASGNRIKLRLKDCEISGNQNTDIIAFGASSATTNPAGKNNIVEISLKGESHEATFLSTSGIPADSAGNNIVNLFK